MPQAFDNFGQKKNDDISGWGSGTYITKLPEPGTARYDNFQGGYSASDNPQNTPTNASPWSENTYTDRKDRIARCPGTVAVHNFSGGVIAG